MGAKPAAFWRGRLIRALGPQAVQGTIVDRDCEGKRGVWEEGRRVFRGGRQLRFHNCHLSIWTQQRNDAGCIGTISVVLADGGVDAATTRENGDFGTSPFYGQLSRV